MNAQERLADVLSRLGGAARSGTDPNQHMAFCPAHTDREKMSLSVSIGENDDMVVMKCLSGCELADICAAIHLKPSELFSSEKRTNFVPKPKTPKMPSDEIEALVGVWAKKLAEWPAVKTLLAKTLFLPESVFEHFPHLGLKLDHPAGDCWTHPECDSDGKMIGVQLRFKDGKKPSVKDTQRGITIPGGWRERPGPLFIVEGLSDTMAMTAAGLACIGRPGVSAKESHYVDFIRKHIPADRKIVVMGENDPKPDGKWPGRDGTAKFCHDLANRTGRTILMAMPPNNEDKDVRGFLTRLEGDGVPWGALGERLLDLIKDKVDEFSPDPKAKCADGSERERVSLDTNHQMKINDEVVTSLAKDKNLYARGNMLVRAILTPGKIIYRGKDKDGKPIPAIVIPAQSRLSAVQVPTLREKISDVVDFYRTAAVNESDGNGEKPKRVKKFVEKKAEVPDWCVTAIHAREEWPTLKNLTALVDYPVLRPDGTIFATKGHDEQTGVYYNHNGNITLPIRPTKADALAAWERLKEVICDFPFEDQEVHQAAWLAALLTPMTRFAFHGCVPVFLIDGNVAGAGKGLLADTIALILTGRPFATMGYTDDNTEMSKRITAIAVEGEQLVMFDNISQGFGGSAIDRALTSLEWSERILGQTKNIKCPLRVGWYGTGNNIELIGDILRRLCQIRLESPDERPEERKNLKHKDLRAWIMMNRDSLLSDAATILAAYYEAGAPKDESLKSWGSFEAWSAIIRQMVVWLGLKDPMETRRYIFSGADATREAMRTIIHHWRAIDPHGEGMTTPAIIASVIPEEEEEEPSAEKKTDDTKSPPRRKPPKIAKELIPTAQALKQLMTRPTGRGLGQFFARFRSTRFNGLFLTQKNHKDRTGLVLWVVHDSKTQDVVAIDWKKSAEFTEIAESVPNSDQGNSENGSGKEIYHSPTGRDSANSSNSANNKEEQKNIIKKPFGYFDDEFKG